MGVCAVWLGITACPKAAFDVNGCVPCNFQVDTCGFYDHCLTWLQRNTCLSFKMQGDCRLARVLDTFHFASLWIHWWNFKKKKNLTDHYQESLVLNCHWPVLTLLSWGLNFASLWIKMVFYRLETMSLMLKPFPGGTLKNFLEATAPKLYQNFFWHLKQSFHFIGSHLNGERNRLPTRCHLVYVATGTFHALSSEQSEREIPSLQPLPRARVQQSRDQRFWSGAYFLLFLPCIFWLYAMSHWPIALFLEWQSTKDTDFGLKKQTKTRRRDLSLPG